MRFVLAILFIHAAWSSPVEVRQSQGDACANVGSLVQHSTHKLDTGVVISGQAAQNCLQSLPFDASTAGRFLTELQKYIQFQSTLEVLKSPPASYVSAPVDILGGLDKISKTRYTNQYQFDSDITDLIRSTNDGHFSLDLCSMSAFSFFRQDVDLVSVSKDGRATPDIYIADDIQALAAGSTSVSPVATVNGQDVMKYLEAVASDSNSQDPDARWNSLFTSFWSLASSTPSPGPLAGRGWFASSGKWPGTNNTQLGLKNGTIVNSVTGAMVWDKPTSASSYYRQLCVPATSSRPTTKRDQANIVTDKRATQPLKAGPSGYPVPTAKDDFNNIVGYNLDAETAVMMIPTFEGPSDSETSNADFSKIASTIVSQAVSSGRTKIIIDLQANGGGSIARAFDLFKLFFPAKFPYSATRFRNHPAIGAMVLALQGQNATLGVTSAFWIQAMVTPAQDQSFTSVDNYLSDPNGKELGVDVSALMANFNFTAENQLTAGSNPIRGFGVPLNATQPFRPEDILIVTDGVCASTCTTFVNLMTNVGGVRAISFGGRPRNEPMQVMGGVRGGQSMGFDLIDTFITLARQAANQSSRAFTTAQIAALPVGLENMPLILPSGSINFRNAYQEGADHLPLQFSYQAADCRLFYTAKNIIDPSSVWADAKDAIWGSKGCVSNSTGGPGSLEDRNKTHGGGGSVGSGGDNSGNGGKDHNAAGDTRLQSGVLALCVLLSTLAIFV